MNLEELVDAYNTELSNILDKHAPLIQRTVNTGVTADGAEKNDVLEKAHDAYERSLDLCERLRASADATEYRRMKAGALMNMGLVYDIRADVSRCAQYFKRAIEITEQCDQLTETQFLCYSNLADLYRRHSGYERAVTYLDMALKCACKLRDKDRQIATQSTKALVYLQREDFHSGRKCLQRAHRLRASNKEVLGKLKTAVRLERAALQLQAASSAEGKLQLLERMGDLCSSLGAFHVALKMYKEMLACAEQLDLAASKMAPIYVSLAATCADVKDFDSAIKYYRQEIACRDDHYQVAKTYLNIAECEDKLGLGNQVWRATYMTALGHAEKARKVKLQIQILKDLAEAQESSGDQAGLGVTTEKLARLREDGEVSGCSEGDGSSEEEQSEEEEESEVDLQELSCSDEDAEAAETLGHARPRSGRPARWFERRNEKGETALHTACIAGNYKRVRELVEKGHPVNLRDYAGWLPLHEACNHAFPPIVEYLLMKGAHVNDAGGADCQRTTPLHDVCAVACAKQDVRHPHTHVQRCLDVIGMLVTHQANTRAKDDDGMTAADYLAAQLKANEECLTREEGAAVRAMVRRLGGVMTGGNPQHRMHAGESEDLPELSAPAKRGRKGRRAAVECDSPPIECDSESESDFPALMPELDALDTLLEHPERAPLAYRGCMQSVGRSAADASALPKSRKKPRLSVPALVTPDVDVGDDWLEDDLRPAKRRRRGTGTARVVAEPAESAEKSTAETRVACRIVESPPSSPVAQQLQNMTPFAAVDTQESEAPASTSAQEGLAPKPAGAHSSAAQGRTSAVSHRPATQPTSVVMRLRVHVKQDTIVVPVKDASLTVGWLAGEVARRYFVRHSVTPILSLTSVDGALYSPDDLLSDLLTDNELVSSVVESWSVSPLPERYANACQTLQTVCYRNISRSLQECDTTACLQLKGLALKRQHFEPIARALLNQSALKELHLQGNKIGDCGLDSLVKALATMPCLAVLDLSCNQLTASALDKLLGGLDKASEKPLQRLQQLDLSFNPLGDSCTLGLIGLLSHLVALSALRLRSCQLTVRVFEKHRPLLAETLKGSGLRELDMSHNRLGCVGVELLLMCLHPGAMVSLNVAGTVPTSAGNTVAMQVAKYLSQDGCGLQKLVLDACHLLPEHIPDLCRGLQTNASLNYLSVCGNQITANDLTDLLQSAATNPNSSLQHVLCKASGLHCPLATDFIDSVNDKLHHCGAALRELVLGGVGHHAGDVASLKEVWGGKWGRLAEYKTEGGILSLAVSEEYQ